MIFTLTLNPVLDRSLTVPALHLNEVLRAVEVHLDWGGKGFNVSRSLKRLGLDSTALGFVGGPTGLRLEKGLSDLGIRTDFVHIEGETRTNTAIIEAGSGVYTKVNEPGPEVTDAEYNALIEKVRGLLQPGTIWALSGSLPPGIPSGVYGELIKIIKIGGGRVYLDASGEALSLGCAAAPFLVKPNLEEAAQVYGQPVASQVDLHQAIACFLDFGIEMVALSSGADGLWLATCASTIHIRPPQITAHNPVGNGDALLAGLVWALSHDLPLVEAARWATACGTASAMASGVNFGSRVEVETLFALMEVEPH